jgi:hypothetical protein
LAWAYDTFEAKLCGIILFILKFYVFIYSCELKVCDIIQCNVKYIWYRLSINIERICATSDETLLVFVM